MWGSYSYWNQEEQRTMKMKEYHEGNINLNSYEPKEVEFLVYFKLGKALIQFLYCYFPHF